MKRDATLCLAFNGHALILHANVPELLTRLAGTFGPMVAAEAAAPIAILEIYRKNGRYTLLNAKNSHITANSQKQFLRYLEHEIILQFILANPDLLWLHAGAVAQNGRAILLAGDWGRGKSTLTAALSTNGYKFLTDDICPLRLQSGELLPFPVLPRVRARTNRILPPVEARNLEKQTAPLPPDAIQTQHATIQMILFPQYRPQAQTALHPVSPAYATAVLLQQNLNLMRHGNTAVAALSRLVSQTAVYEMPFSDAGDAVALITKKWGRASSPPPASSDTYDRFIPITAR